MNGDSVFVIDEGNYIFDLYLNWIVNLCQFSFVLNQVLGVVENGLFLDICDVVVLGFGDGCVEVYDINYGFVEEIKFDFFENDNIFIDILD